MWGAGLGEGEEVLEDKAVKKWVGGRVDAMALHSTQAGKCAVLVAAGRGYTLQLDLNAHE